MRCPQCHANNPDGATACLQCGTTLALTCPHCGTELPPQANFCFHCGSAVGAEGGRAVRGLDEAIQRLIPREYAERLLATRGRVGKERRTVTILFSDVKGSTALAEGLDPEEVMEVMDGAFDVLILPIYYYEGTLARLMGDAVLAFFGAPIAHEDDPERACRAALEITAEATRYAQRLQEERGLAGFNVRVGIHTGLVVMGEVGTDLRVEYTAMGEAVNLAQRLQSSAEPGHVLISADTQRLIVPLFETEPLGEMALRGRSQPVAVYRVVAARPVERKPRGIAGLDSPLVGREAEMAALQGAIERLRGGQGGIVTIVGEAGIGKSRLVAEARKGLLSTHRHPEGIEGSSSSEEEKILRPFGAQNDKPAPLQWIEGRCLSYSASIAYQLWTDVLRHLLDIPPDASPQQADQVLRQRVHELCPQRFDGIYPYLARILALPLDEDTEDRLAELSGEQIRAATFDAVQTLIECTARQGALVLVCEDIYWSDPTSMELVELQLPLTERLPLLLICVFRPRKEHRSWRVREAAVRHHARRHTDLWLQPLSEGHSEQLVSNLLPMSTVPETLQQRILERAEGNPFYVEEIIRALIAQGALAQDETGQWILTRELAEIAIPDTLNGVLTARIDQLSDDTRRVLQMASVIGRLFTYPVLAAIARLDGQLEPHLTDLQEAELIRERARQPERQYIFKHELTREAAYNGLLKKERRVLHRHVAEALERLFPEHVDEQLGLLAQHWERAGDADKAIDYSLRAGDRARLAYAHAEAEQHYQRALPLAEERGLQPQAARAWLKLGLTYHGKPDFARARQAYDRGFALWQQATKAPPPTLPPAPHALRMDYYPEPLVLDPCLTRDRYSRVIEHQLFTTLLQHSPQLDVMPGAAREWKVTEGGHRYTFHLRDDLRWSDGTPVTAGDFEYAVKRALNPASRNSGVRVSCDIRGVRAFYEGQVSDVDQVGVRALDDTTLAVELEAPVPYYLHMAARWYPVPRHLIEKCGPAWSAPENIVTCGPFLLQSWHRGESLVLARDPHYPGPFSGNVERVILHLGYDPARHLRMYEDDELDVFWPEELPTAQMNLARQRHPAEDLTMPRATLKVIAFDCSRSPFDQARVRRAFALATNRAALSGVASFAAFPATGGFIPPGAPGHVPDIALPYDPQRARQELAEAGYPGGRGFPSVAAAITKGLEDALQELAAQWCKVLGVDVTCQGLDWADFMARLATDPPQVFVIGASAYVPDPHHFLAPEHFVGRWTRWKHQGYRRLTDEARLLPDPKTRLELYAQAEHILVDEAPLVPLMYGISFTLVKPWVMRYPTSLLKWPFWKDVVLEPH